MKNFKVLFAALITVAVVAFAGCDPCKKVECRNGGTCVDGTCSCPAGFGGEFCEVDSCASVVCLNGGSCDGGDCVCPTGYEGSDCGTESRAKYLGTYDGKYSCDGGGVNPYVTSILKTDDNIFSIEINNFANYQNRAYPDSSVYGIVRNDSMLIDNMVIPANGYTLTISNGIGVYNQSGGYWVLSYTADDGFISNCVDTLMMQ